MTKVNEHTALAGFAALWIGLCGLAGLAGWLAGAPLSGTLAAMAFLTLPGWAALASSGDVATSGVRPAAVQVLAWTLVSLVAVAVSGGARSPLVVLFAIGPLVGLAAGRVRMALEAAGFAILAYAGLVVLQWFAGPPPRIEPLASLEPAIVLAALVSAGWLAGQVPYPRGSQVPSDRPQAARSGLALNTLAGAPWPETAPVLLVELTRHGRVVRRLGRSDLAPRLQPGQLAEYGFGEGVETDIARLIREPGHLRLERSGAPALELYLRFGETHGWLLIMPVASAPGEVAGLKARHDKALAERTEFFASLGHELKTPLNAIIGFCDIMRSGVRGRLDPPHDEYAEIINDSAHDLLLLVEDILDLARSENGRQALSKEPVDLVEAGRNVMRQLEPQAHRGGIEIHMLANAPVRADADRRAIRQIWQNLVSNAVKYSEGGGAVRLDAGHVGDQVWMSVEDEGAGMDEADLARIAAPFAQGDNARGRAGTGLGLAVVKRFADLHDGQVRIDTAPGQGTSVRVTLPRAQEESSQGLRDAAE